MVTWSDEFKYMLRLTRTFLLPILFSNYLSILCALLCLYLSSSLVSAHSYLKRPLIRLNRDRLLVKCMWCVCVSGRGAGAKPEADNHRLPVEEVWAEQETPGGLQQEAAGLCTGTPLTGHPHVKTVFHVKYIFKKFSFSYKRISWDESLYIFLSVDKFHVEAMNNECVLFTSLMCGS